MSGVLDVYDRYGGDYLYKYVKQFADTMINENGRIYGYKKTNYNLDHVNSGKILFRLYEREKDPRYKIAMDTLRAQLASSLVLRTEDFGIKNISVSNVARWNLYGITFLCSICRNI